MFFRKFNLKECIRFCNQKYNTSYSDYSSFNFQIFENDTLENIDGIIDCINGAHELCIYNNTESQYIKSFNKEARDTINDFQGSIGRKSTKKGGILDNLPFTSEQIDNLILSLQLKDVWLKWSNTNWESINKILLKNSLHTTDDLYKLSIYWDKHYQLARCNDTAIYRLAKESLPFLAKYIKKARKKLKANNHHIPDLIIAAFGNYLNELEKDIQNFQTIVVESMLARLKAFDDSKGKHSNPILYTANLLNPSSNFPKHPFSISKDEFNYYHEFIEQYGDQTHKTEVLQRSWYLSNSVIPVTIINTYDNGALIVPTKLSHLVPIKKRWPNWLFNDNLRQEIFKQNNILFATLSFQINKPEYFIDIYDFTSIVQPINDIQSCETLVLDEIAKFTRPPISQIPWYAFGTKYLLSQWKSILIDERSKLIEKKFSLAERLINCLKSKAVSPMNIPWKTYELLINLSQELEVLARDSSINKSLQERMFAINSTLSKYASIVKFVEILKILANGKLPTDEQLDYLHRFMDGRIKLEPNFLESFKRFCKPQLDLIYDKFLNLLKVNPFNLNNSNKLKEHEKLTLALFRVLDKSKLVDCNDSYTKKILKLALHHLQKLYLDKNDKLSDSFVVSKNMIAMLGKEMNYLDEPIIIHINALEQLKNNNNLLFKINCKTLILTISNSLLTQHFNKELIKFDDYITNVLKENDLSVEAITVLNKKRDELIEKDSIDNIHFTPSEAKMLNADLTNTTQKIISLLSMSSKAHQIKNALASNIKPEDKPLLIKQLAKLISDNIQKSKTVTSIPKCWFSKQYVDENIYDQSLTIKQFRI